MARGLKTGPFIGCVMEKDNIGNPVRVAGNTKSWVTATTSGNFVLATTQSGKFIRIMDLMVTSNVTTRFQLKSGSSTTISPHINISAASPYHEGSESFALAPYMSASGESVQLHLTAGEDGIGTGALITARVLSVATTN